MEYSNRLQHEFDPVFYEIGDQTFYGEFGSRNDPRVFSPTLRPGMYRVVNGELCKVLVGSVP